MVTSPSPQGPESSTHILTKQQIDAWRHALLTAGHEFSNAAGRLRTALRELPLACVQSGEVKVGTERLVHVLTQQAREAWAASDMLETATEVTVRTAPEGGAA